MMPSGIEEEDVGPSDPSKFESSGCVAAVLLGFEEEEVGTTYLKALALLTEVTPRLDTMKYLLGMFPERRPRRFPKYEPLLVSALWSSLVASATRISRWSARCAVSSPADPLRAADLVNVVVAL